MVISAPFAKARSRASLCARVSECIDKSSNVDEYDVKSEGPGNSSESVNSDLYQAVFPIYHLSKLSGVFPMRFVRQAPGRYQGRLSTIDSVYSLCLLASLIGAEIWGFWRDLRDGWEFSTRLKSQNAVIVTCSDVLGVMGLTAVSILSSTRSVSPRGLAKCDERMGIVSPRKIRRYTILLTVSSLSYSILISCLDIYTWGQVKLEKEDKGPLNYLPLYFMYIVIIMMEVQYAIATYNVGQRFLRLNTSLGNILRQDPGNARLFRKSKIIDSFVANDGKGSTDNIAELVTVHGSLCDTVTNVNAAYGVVILVVTITCLIHLVITPYFLIMEADGKRQPLFLVVQSMWCIFHVWRLLIFVQPSYAASIEAKKTAVLVSQLLSASHDKESKAELEIFSLQLLHRPLEFSACGLFALDRGLVTSIAGAVTTYLVILIQFQKDDDTKGTVDILKNATLMLKNASTLYNITAGKLNLN